MNHMNILIPMAGAGKRFADVGYNVSKPVIPTYSRKTGRLLPMVVCATNDLPGVMEDGSNVIYVDRDFHKTDGVEDEIRNYYKKASFISVGRLTEGQACTCLLAENSINNDQELLIASCDNGLEYNSLNFDMLKEEADVLVFTYRNNEVVLRNPDAYGWVIVEGNNTIIDVSVKKAISENPLRDHAIVGTFWFKKGKIFVETALKMIEENDRVNNEYYVDQVIKHVIRMGYIAKIFEIDKYICWGTPKDYEEYQSTFEYWKKFYEKSRIL